jgi:hypothetical protein
MLMVPLLGCERPALARAAGIIAAIDIMAVT